nr:hypothetical protein [Clostridia bacterium]
MTECKNCKKHVEGYMMTCPNCGANICPACANGTQNICPYCYSTLDYMI